MPAASCPTRASSRWDTSSRRTSSRTAIGQPTKRCGAAAPPPPPRGEWDGDRPAHEARWLGIALPGLRQPRAWHAGRERVDIYDVKGAATLVLAAAGVSAFDVVAGAAGGPPGG